MTLGERNLAGLAVPQQLLLPHPPDHEHCSTRSALPLSREGCPLQTPSSCYSSSVLWQPEALCHSCTLITEEEEQGGEGTGKEEEESTPLFLCVPLSYFALGLFSIRTPSSHSRDCLREQEGEVNEFSLSLSCPLLVDWSFVHLLSFRCVLSSSCLFCLFVFISFSQAEAEKGDFSKLEEIHSVTSCLKATISLAVADGMEKCRKACGGHGFLLASGIALQFANFVPVATYEVCLSLSLSLSLDLSFLSLPVFLFTLSLSCSDRCLSALAMLRGWIDSRRVVSRGDSYVDRWGVDRQVEVVSIVKGRQICVPG